MHIDKADLQLFLDEVRSRYGLVFEPSRHDELRELLRERTRAHSFSSVRDYIATLRTSEGEWQEIANRLTVPETYFFRIPEQFEAFSAISIPQLIEQRAAVKTLRLASFGCASGEEPYTMAMILRAQFPELNNWGIDICGFDVSQRSLDRATRAVYSKWSLRATPEQMQTRFFRETRDGWALDPQLRSMVRFEAKNILQISESAATFDVVFFRNVLIYFSPDSIRIAVDAAASVIAPGGYLFIGTAESLRGVTNAFSLCHSHGAFYYRREGMVPKVRPKHTPRTEDSRPTHEIVPEPPSSPPLATGSWIDEIQHSSMRVNEITSASGGAVPRKRISRRSALHTAMAMFADEKYSEALQHLDSLSDEDGADADVQVLRAVLLTNSGQIAAAEAAAQATLKHDHLNPGAHYVLALCEEQKQDLTAALEHDLMAAYLDPGFAMPHVHAATIYRRKDELDAACDELERALLLLGSEDAARIPLFGGGFSREALQSYCEREMNRCRGGK